jgi:hypothetical protein
MISVDEEKIFDKIQHAIVVKSLHPLGLDGVYFNIIKANT